MTVDQPFDIVIAAPNPAVDSYYFLESFEPGAVNRAQRAFHTAGGKGNNMARAAVRLGGRVLSLGIVGGPSGHLIDHHLNDEGIEHHLVWAEKETRRSNTIAVEGMEDTTVLLEPGEAVGELARKEFLDIVRNRACEGRWLVLNGSLPPDFPDSTYADLISSIRRNEVPIGVDTAGEALKFASEAGPDLLKVNKKEFADAFVQSKDFDAGEMMQVYKDLFSKGVEHLVVTEGEAGAVVLSSQCDPFRVWTPTEHKRSSAGAGDTFMAALCLQLGRGHSIQESARFASAAAVANLAEIGCGFIELPEVESLLSVTELSYLAAGS